MFHGSITALITPFRNGDIDWPAFDLLIEDQITQGPHAIVACGTTGESPCLTNDDHNRIVERAIAVVKGRIPVIAGTGTNSTQSTIETTLHAQRQRADAALIVTPYSNKPTQDGLYAHYKAIHDATDIPVIIYNIPKHCIVDMSVDTMSRLAELPRIVGVKDATADLARPTLLRCRVGADFCQLSGEDATALPFLAAGGHGCISVVSNIAPALCAQMQNAWVDGNIKDAEAIRDRIAPLIQSLFVETSPAPVKYAASKLGLCTDEMRLPMLPATQNARERVDRAMALCGLLPRQQPAQARTA
jgi:4-hydroxy-tetrahydrodipicolinate synthase